MVGVRTYEAAVEDAFGRRVATLFKATVVVYVFGVLVGYMVIIGDLLPSTLRVLCHLPPVHGSSDGSLTAAMALLDWLLTPTVIQVAVTATCVLPLCLQRRMDSLRFASMLAIGAVLYFTLMVVYRSTNNIFRTQGRHGGVPCWHEEHSSVALLHLSFEDFFFALPILAFALGGHLQGISIYSELDQRHRSDVASGMRTWGRVVAATVLFLSAIYIVVGFLSYVCLIGGSGGASGPISANILLDLLVRYPYDALLQVATIAIAAVVVLSYPLMHFSMRLSLDLLLFGGWCDNGTEPFTGRYATLRFRAETLAIVLGTLVVAVLVGNLKLVFGLVGATGSVLFKFVLPALIFLTVARRSSRQAAAVPQAVEMEDLAAAASERVRVEQEVEEWDWEASDGGHATLRQVNQAEEPQLVLSTDGLEGLVVQRASVDVGVSAGRGRGGETSLSRGHVLACGVLILMGSALGCVSTYTVIASAT